MRYRFTDHSRNQKGKVKGVYVTEAHLLEQDHKQGIPEVALRNAAVEAGIV